ncbi:MAG: hypothetical protein ACT4NU_11120 [Chromatiales bacterium]
MLDSEFCRQILKLHEPWQVEGVQVDKPSNRIDIEVGFGPGRPSLFRKHRPCPRCRCALPFARDCKRIVLRHLNFGEMRTYLSVPIMPGGGTSECACQRSWAKPGSRFTHEMERVIVEALRMLNSVNAVSRLLSINAADICGVNERNRILETDEPVGALASTIAYGKAHFDDGGLEVAYLDHEAEEEPAQRPITAVSSASASECVPHESHPVWQRLIDEQTAVHIRALGLKMLLEQIRLTVASNPTEKSRIAGARILRQYFVKHWSRHKIELAQLLDLVAPSGVTASPARSEADLPPENDVSWQHMIDGDIIVRSDAIGLKMLIERLRLSLGGQPTPAGRLAGARILRQYFIKHHGRHRAELAQLQAFAAAQRRGPGTPTKADAEVPAETARCWQLLIDGALDIQSSAVGLTMLLERIRLTLGRSPSEPARLAAARVLRQYFEKYRARHERELRLLAGSDTAPPATGGGQVVEFVEVPAENHPSWQRLINGELQIKTDALGLKMLLERVRLSLGTHPTEALRLAAARVLRQYFIKHRSRHRAELEQLKAA